MISDNWICYICNENFDTGSGGVCLRCGKIVCFEHCKKLKKTGELVCVNCLKENDEVENFMGSLLSNIFK